MPYVRNDTLKGTSDKVNQAILASKSNQATGMGAGAHPAEVLIPPKAGAEASTPQHPWFLHTNTKACELSCKIMSSHQRVYR